MNRNGTLLTVGLALLAAGGAIVAAGADQAWLSLKGAFGYYPAPKILRVTEVEGAKLPTFQLTIRNPSHEEVALTGYRADPEQMSAAASRTTEGGGEATEISALDVPGKCSGAGRERSFARTVVVSPKGTVDLTIHPWLKGENCPFDVVVHSDHGDTQSRSSWATEVNEVELAPGARIPPPPAPQSESR